MTAINQLAEQPHRHHLRAASDPLRRLCQSNFTEVDEGRFEE
jgi:hypothetical protein